MSSNQSVVKRIEYLFGAPTHGWKGKAANSLGLSRPTLNRYLKLSQIGDEEKIPDALLMSLFQLEAVSTSKVEGAEFDWWAMIQDLAAGLMIIQDDLDRTGRVSTPYPDQILSAFHKASWARKRGVPGSDSLPMDLAALLRVAERPLFEWAYHAEDEGIEPFLHAALWENGAVTNECMDLAGIKPRDEEHSYYEFLMQHCRDLDEADGQRLYEAWRRTVIESPVAEGYAALLTGHGLARHVSVLHELINKFYDCVPPMQSTDGGILLCPTTGTRLHRVHGGLTTESRDPKIRRTLSREGANTITWTPQTIELRRPVRMSWCLPGIYEVQIERKAKELGYQVQMWPKLDTVDLVVSHTKKNLRFAIDVKDYLSPRTLALRFAGFSGFKRHHRLLVIPDYLAEQSGNYKNIFSAARKSAGLEDVAILTISGLLNELERQA